MPKIQAMTRGPRLKFSAPASALLPQSDHERFKLCLTEQTSLAGKKECFDEYQMTKEE